jgi:Zn finger protein HypA/HybF involved in hydrogenase expression
MEVPPTMSSTQKSELFQVGDEVTGTFRCAECDLLVNSPRENDGVLVLGLCPLCGSEEWRRVG